MNLAPLFHRTSVVDPVECDPNRDMRLLYCLLSLFAVGTLLYSQTLAFHWDEGFHILTADLIDAGKRPYLDFFFPQTPLNAYWNAAWMGIFGAKWRVVHAVAALATIGSVLLIVQYVFGLLSDRRWQRTAVFAALALFGLHSLVWEYGTTAQAYPLCLLLVVAAFRSAISAVKRTYFGMSTLSGLLAGAGAASSLLTAPASAVLLIWLWLYNRRGNRWLKAAAFLAGAIVSFFPVLVLFSRGPHQVVFNVVKYHSIYRRVNWEAATSHDIAIVTDWINSSPSLLLVLLALAGLLYSKKNQFNPELRSELRLCIWLIIAIAAQNLIAHPTFPQYFVFLIPFLTVWGVVGFYGVLARLEFLDRPMRPVLVLLCIAALCLGNSVYNERDSYTWHQLERVTTKVKEVTPKFAPLLAPEQIYFLTRWPVPSGMEHSDASKLQLSSGENAILHILPQAEIDRQVKSGAFATAVVCADEDAVNEMKEWKVYSQKAEFDECTVFWQFDRKAKQPQPQR